jgi:hypothetical protein
MTFQIKKATIVDEQRFWGNADRTGGPDACWPWQNSTAAGGYGAMHTKAGRLKAHRIAYRLAHGPLVPGLSVCHTCDNPSCVNPAHLYQGTHKQNMRDRAARGRGGDLRGQQNGRAKLTDDTVRAIRALAERGEPNVAIARRFGVTDVMVSKIRRGVAWRHVGGNA